MIVSLGSAIVTLNAKLLGGNISFLQTTCCLGYCIFPLVIAALVSTFVKLIWGTVISIDDLNTQDLTGDEGKWLEDDVAALKNCPNVLHELPQSIDLLLLDGGEFSTLAEFQLLSSRVTKWLILDDTNTRKCRTIATNIRTGMTPFTPIVDSDDRNGFMVALKS